MRILLVLGSLILGSVAGVYLFSAIWQNTAPESTMAIAVGGGTPVVFGVLTYLWSRTTDGDGPSLGRARTWLAILGIALASAGLFVLLIVAAAVVAQRG
ncbi:hypothetical protein [Shinella sp. M31]|uniref:hypothetical protein n=1 Tax=Shinella sp. M31 TaxID=3368615 RepID=UPI003BA024E9